MKRALLIIWLLPLQATDWLPRTVGRPYPMCVETINNNLSAFTINGATDKFMPAAFQASAAETITTLCFKYGTRTGTPVQHKIGLQSITVTNGNPDGTFLGGGTPASGLFTPPADTTWNNTQQCVTLDNSYATTRGTVYAIVIEPVGTPDGSNSSSFTYGHDGACVTRAGFPYTATNDAGTWTKQATQGFWAYRTSSRTVGYMATSFANTGYSSNSSPDEYAMRFKLDAGFGATYSVVGCRCLTTSAASGKTTVVALYSGTTVLQDVTIDSDLTPTTSSTFRVLDVMFDESSLSTLDFGTEYRIGFQPQEASHNFALNSFTVAAAGDLSAVGGGIEFYLSTRTNAGAWSDTTTTRPICELIVQDWNEPAGGSGGAYTSVARNQPANPLNWFVKSPPRPYRKVR